MPESKRYTNSNRVVHETIDGETILIHLDTGAYYSLDGSGADAWQLLSSGHSAADVESSMAVRYAAEPSEISQALAQLAGELFDEGLLAAAAPGAPLAEAANGSPPPAASERPPFEPPQLRKYTDMQEFLLVDPIHETDVATGWPNVKPAP